MKKEEFYKEIRNTLKEIELTENQIEQFYNYMNGILKWNKSINVTSITDEKMFIVKHFADSLTINRFVEDKKTLIDIGTGAGFPGIPLKIVNKDLKVTLIDSVNKKLNIIRDITADFNLENLEIIHTRAEDLANDIEYREKYDIATTRAVSNLTTIAEYMLPFVKINGYAICMKGPNIRQELEDSKVAIEVLGGKLEKIESLNVGNELERNIILIKKVKSTPKKFPRGKGKPLKEPIR
ncbi:MAG TPA: 16S rRNA (guanine(527)-N(7))-methyltransferase RsmG [Candidatus Scatovivens faecipullorum]|jgi:16S rRNA methyltransferase gidB|nr:16S rRNA (guanine(527)-N(7))-methyltransferase RsmG [Candidatus Scatovivens faecipullorum]